MTRRIEAAALTAMTILALAVPATVATAADKGPAPILAAGASAFPARVNRENRVSIRVTPMDLGPGRPATFKVAINTHSGSLNFDLTRISVLEDDKGAVYRPTRWEGSPPGGHHRRGTLSFPAIGADARSVRLTIRNVNDVPERVFEWVLKQ